MANPQKENGYTPIANELLEAIYAADFTATQLKLVLLIARYTYGFSRKSHAMSTAFMHQAIGGNERNMRRELQHLIDASVITVYTEASFKAPRELGINKNYQAWDERFQPKCPVQVHTGEGVQDQSVPVEPEGAYTPRGGEQAQTGLGVQAHTGEGVHAPQDKQYIKQNIKQDAQTLFERVWSLYPEKKGKGKVSDADKSKLFSYGYDVIKLCIDRYIADKPDWKQYQHGATFFHSGYIDYLDGNYQPGNSRASPEHKDGTAHPDGGIWHDGKQLKGVNPYDTA
jgi:phage replication O-like protein O